MWITGAREPAFPRDETSIRSVRVSPSLSEINITPLLDLAFVLLIIFMITTPLLENSMSLIIPSSGVEELRRPRRKCRRSRSIATKRFA